MKFRHYLYGSLFLILLFYSAGVSAKNIEIISSLQNENRTLDTPIDLFLTDAANPINNSTINLVSQDAWLFFENMKPSKVMEKYKTAIKINGAAIDPYTDINCRVVVYKQGTVVIPHPNGFRPLETFTAANFSGNSQKHLVDQFYTNEPYKEIPSDRIEALENDNSIRSFKLKRGYMATFANEPDGMGYSRCFIADEEDLEISQLQVELDGKVSFIRVFPWEWVSKKGWVGTYWGPGDDGKGGVDEGLRYVDEQSDLTNSTWYYTWGASVYGSKNATETNLINQEFVPEKWGKGGNVKPFFTNKRWSHLIGQNEPDHAEQSNVTPEEAAEEWATLLKTGARLGTPATTDFGWLYRFMSLCEERNYRVDFVVVHGYWTKSASSWLNDLKSVHDRTGRPIWIKEWNNGANWTGESWPDGSKGNRPYTEANANKMLNDLKGILKVMDEAPFMERYSIYNWVEDARALILGNDAGSYGKGSTLTKAGEYYAQNSPGLAFNREKEVIPTWSMHPVQLAYTFSEAEGKLRLEWDDYNGELTVKYLIERSFDGNSWETIGEITSPYTHEYYTEVLTSDNMPTGEVHYRIKNIGCDDTEKTSNVVKYDLIKNQKTTPITTTNLKVKEDWSVSFFENELSGDMVFSLGTPTYRNRQPLTARTRNVNAHSVEMQLRTWDYLENPTFNNPDTLAFMAIPKGSHQFGTVKIEAGTIKDVSKAWKTITFETPFNVVPVVFVSQITANDPTASAVRIKNITKTGFDIVRKYEQGKPNVFEDVSYIAATPGTGLYDGENRIEVGITPDAAGISYSKPATITFENTFNEPAFFGFMQTCNDEVAATLRLKTRTGNKVEIFKEKEKSANNADPKAERIGWMVLGTNVSSTGINNIVAGANNRIVFESGVDKIYLSDNQLMNKVDIYSVLGAKIVSETEVYELNVASLQSGVYIVIVNGVECLKFIK